MILANLLLREQSQTQKTTHSVIPFTNEGPKEAHL